MLEDNMVVPVVSVLHRTVYDWLPPRIVSLLQTNLSVLGVRVDPLHP